jgi:hypothetical protein
MVNKTPRAVETREATTRSKQWTPPSTLPTPDPSDGFRYRWIRTATLGASDAPNVSNKFRQGWVPVKKEDHPEITVMADRNSDFPENIEIGGLILCKIPEEVADQRNDYYENAARQQLESVDQSLMRESNASMPILKPERKSRVEFGRHGSSPRRED